MFRLFISVASLKLLFAELEIVCSTFRSYQQLLWEWEVTRLVPSFLQWCIRLFTITWRTQYREAPFLNIPWKMWTWVKSTCLIAWMSWYKAKERFASTCTFVLSLTYFEILCDYALLSLTPPPASSPSVWYGHDIIYFPTPQVPHWRPRDESSTPRNRPSKVTIVYSYTVLILYIQQDNFTKCTGDMWLLSYIEQTNLALYLCVLSLYRSIGEYNGEAGSFLTSCLRILSRNEVDYLNTLVRELESTWSIVL